MQLFGSFTSPYVRHIRIVLARTGQECDFVETDYAASAEQSPAARVPFLHDGDRKLTDSLSILRLLRERAGQAFFPSLDEFDRFLLVDTTMDTAVNLFLLERDGLGPAQAPYLERQQSRVRQCLEALEQALEPDPPAPDTDFALRLGCFLSWALFRERLSLDQLPSLAMFQQRFEDDPLVAATHPSRSG